MSVKKAAAKAAPKAVKPREARQYSSGPEAMKPVALVKRAAFAPDADSEGELICLYPQARYQTVIGFGGAFTGAAAANYAAAPAAVKKQIVEALFNPDKGLGYTFCRTTIHSADFAPESFSYVADGDRSLKSFSVAHDEADVIPFVKDSLAACGKYRRQLRLFASPWSPPAFMKTNGKMIEGGKLRPDCAALWADYVVKYLKAYAKHGIKFFAITVQNEPKARQTWESCQYTAAEEGRFIREHLRPALDRAGFKNLKIMIWDHNKERLVERAAETLAMKGVADAVWGLAFHWYSGPHFGAVEAAARAFPDKPLVLSEFCHENLAQGWGLTRAYLEEILGDLGAGAAAIVDWNMVLDLDGGPYHCRQGGGCAAALTYDPQKKKLASQPLYHAIAQFSRFIHPGAVRVGSSVYHRDLQAVAFRNPDGSLVAVALNVGEEARPARLRLDGANTAAFTLAPRSASTFVL